MSSFIIASIISFIHRLKGLRQQPPGPGAVLGQRGQAELLGEGALEPPERTGIHEGKRWEVGGGEEARGAGGAPHKAWPGRDRVCGSGRLGRLILFCPDS